MAAGRLAMSERVSPVDYIALDEADRVAAQTSFAGNILVSAAAGSGKTSSLTKRVINCLAQKNADGSLVNIEQIMMVTFTDAATTEMRSRIAAELDDAIQKCQDSVLRRHYRRQQALLGNAYISTIHSLCSRLVRDNFQLLGIDPKLKLLDANEAKMLQQDCIEELFEQFYQSGNEQFLHLVEWFCSDKGDDALYDAVFVLREFAANRLDDRGWLVDLAERFWPEGVDAVNDCGWGRRLFEMTTADLQQACDLYREAYAAGLANGQLPEVTGIATGELAQAEFFLAQAAGRDYVELHQSLSQAGFSGWTASGLSKRSQHVKANADDFAYIKEQIELARELIKKIQGYFVLPQEKLLARLNASKSIVTVLAKVTLAFTERYSALKRERSKMDFNDLERYCVALLQLETARPVLQALQARFVEIMTDEYQDTNEVQEQILQLLAGSSVRRFMVGDIKQSIYGFRQADPTIFSGKLKRYEQGKGGCALTLTRNFRSRRAVLDAANFVFERIMSEACGGMEYDERAALRYGAAKIYDVPAAGQKTLDAVTELIIINKDNKPAQRAAENEFAEKAAAEAQVIADKIRELILAAPSVYEKNEEGGGFWRPITYRDCVILLRKKSSAPEIQTVLRDNGIPCYSDIGSSYFLAYEVRIMLSLLAVIDNPLQDIPLAGALRSPVFACSDEELAVIRINGGKGCLWQALNEYSQKSGELAQKTVAIIKQINSWRESNKQMQIHELLQQVYDQSRFFDYVAALPSGNIRQANLRMLSEYALAFERADFKGLFRFLKYIELLKKRDQELDEGKALSANDDVVRIVTAHGSKGLEYPVVFVPEIGREFGGGAERTLFNLHKDYGIGPRFVDLEENLIYDSLPRLVNSESKRLDELAEELRILYVAMTRAREKLILVGSVARGLLRNRAEEWAKQRKATKLSPRWVARQKSWLDWIGAAVATVDTSGILQRMDAANEPVSGWSVTIRPVESIPVVEARVERGSFTDELESAALDEKINYEITAALDWNYATLHSRTTLPPKLTVSELKRQALTAEEQPESGELIPMAQTFPSSAKSAAELGTAYHEIFQRLDFAVENYRDNVEAVITALVLQNIIPKELARKIDRNAIVTFMASGLTDRIRAAKTVRREQQFVVAIGADELDKTSTETDCVLVQGIIDLLLVEADGTVVLVDYKTDNVADSNVLRERYDTQLQYYALAVERITGMPVSEKIIWHVPTATAVKCCSLN